jgi:hypothetical protein
MQAGAQLIGQFDACAVRALHMRRDADDVLGRAFDEQRARAVRFGQHRDAAALEIEWNLIDLAPVRRVDGAMRLDGIVRIITKGLANRWANRSQAGVRLGAAAPLPP